MAVKNISVKQIELRGLEAAIDKNDAKGYTVDQRSGQSLLEYRFKPRYYKRDT